MENKEPRRYKYRNKDGISATGRQEGWAYGVYFPGTDLNVGEMGGLGTGAPKNVEWIDAKPEHLDGATRLN